MGASSSLRPRELTEYDPPADVYAAGAVVWRETAKGIDVLVVHRPSYDDWSFPKGKLKACESMRQCAIRELKEETGVNAVLGRPLGWVEYKLSDKRRKAVQFWVAQESPEGSLHLAARQTVKRAPKTEVDRVVWMSLAKAQAKLTTDSDRRLARRVAEWYQAGELKTFPVIIVRHAKALKRSAWKKGHGAERRRPLTARGYRQSQALVGDLSAYGISLVVTSPWKRCVDTVKPYVRATQVRNVGSEAFTERQFEKHPEVFVQQVEHLVSGQGTDAVLSSVLNDCKKSEGASGRSYIRNTHSIALCLHRPTLEEALGVVRRHSLGHSKKALPKKDTLLKPSEYIVAHRIDVQDKTAKASERRGISTRCVDVQIVEIECVGQIA